MAATATSPPTAALQWDGGRLRILDQTLLPAHETWLELHGAADTAAAIARLAIRGAPNIGIAAAYGLALEVATAPQASAIDAAATLLRGARPTAVNLARAINRVQVAAQLAPEAQRWRAAGPARRWRSSPSSRSEARYPCWPARRARCCRARG